MLLLWDCSSTGLGLLSVPPDLVAFPVGMLLVLMLLGHNDTGQAGGQLMRAPGGVIRKCCEHLHWRGASVA